MQSTVILQTVGGQKSFSAVRTAIRLLIGRRTGVDAVVVANSAFGDELFAADGTDEWVEAGVAAKMCH